MATPARLHAKGRACADSRRDFWTTNLKTAVNVPLAECHVNVHESDTQLTAHLHASDVCMFINVREPSDTDHYLARLQLYINLAGIMLHIEPNLLLLVPTVWPSQASQRYSCRAPPPP